MHELLCFITGGLIAYVIVSVRGKYQKEIISHVLEEMLDSEKHEPYTTEDQIKANLDYVNKLLTLNL